MGPHGHGHQQIAGGSAVDALIAQAPEGYGLSVVDTGGNGHADSLFLPNPAVALAGGARGMNHLTAAVAAGALTGGLHHTHCRALGADHRTPAAAIRAGLRVGTLGAAGAFTIRAGFHHVHGNFLFAAEHSLFKVQCQIDPDIFALPGTVVPALSAAEAAAKSAETAAENGAQNISQVVKSAETAVESSKAGVGVEGRKAVLVILCPLVCIGKDLVSLVDFLELRLSLFVSGVQVRVILLCQFPVSFFQFIVRGCFAHAKDFIIITFVCHFSSRRALPMVLIGPPRTSSQNRSGDGFCNLTRLCRNESVV